MKRLGRLSEAIGILREGLRLRGDADEGFRRAVALWNLACYESLVNRDRMKPEVVRSVVEVLNEALRNAPEFRDSLTAETLDADLVPLLGSPIFEQWRSSVLAGRVTR